MRATELPSFRGIQFSGGREAVVPSLEAMRLMPICKGFIRRMALFCCTFRIRAADISWYCRRDTCAAGKLAARQAGATDTGAALLRSLATRWAAEAEGTMENSAPAIRQALSKKRRSDFMCGFLPAR